LGAATACPAVAPLLRARQNRHPVVLSSNPNEIELLPLLSGRRQQFDRPP
jgi:hypothetical protein